MPKGVFLSHKNIISTLASVEHTIARFQKGNQIGPLGVTQEKYFAFLPMAHIYARLMEAYNLVYGNEVCFYRKNPKLIAEDLKI